MLKKYKGSGLVILALVGAAVVGVTSLSLAKANSVAVSSLKGNTIALQAQQYADAEAQLIKATAYNDLAAKAKTNIANTNGFQSEITLSAESDYSDTIKQKIATVKIYRTGESTPRITLDVKRLNKELQPASGVPVGTIIAWPGSSAPTEGGTWLLCNGQSCAAYPELVAVLGKNTVPDYRGRFLEGSEMAGIVKEAGLPNITGNIVLRQGNEGAYPSGVFTYSVTGNRGYKGGSYGNYGKVVFDASRSSVVYGNSDTVQPPSVTVRYLIKAA